MAAGALFLVAGVVVPDPAEAVVGWLFIACFYGGGMYALQYRRSVRRILDDPQQLPETEGVGPPAEEAHVPRGMPTSLANA
jgi:hypothetical protein